MRKDLESRLNIISKTELPKNLKRRIRRFARDGRIVYGPVEVKKFREYKEYYSLDLVLHRCAEDEMGFHNFLYKDVQFKKYDR